jgi:hypothetical protein
LVNDDPGQHTGPIYNDQSLDLPTKAKASSINTLILFTLTGKGKTPSGRPTVQTGSCVKRIFEKLKVQMAGTVNPHGSQMADFCKQHDTEPSCSLGAQSFLTG